MPDSALLQLNLDPLAAVAKVRAVLPGILLMRDSTEGGVKLFDLRNLDQLETYALALLIALERQQAYTVLVNAYGELRRAVTYLRWSYGDEDAIAPSLFGGKRRKSSADDELETASEPATAQTNTTAPAAGLGNPPIAAASGANNAPARVAAGQANCCTYSRPWNGVRRVGTVIPRLRATR